MVAFFLQTSRMSRSPASSGLLPMPGSPSSSWALYRARFASIFQNADTLVFIAFWLFGLINNVLYVIILSAAQDLVGSDVPKGLVLLADVLPSFLTKLIAPYFIHKVPYWLRIIMFAAASSIGMFMIALTPPEKSVAVKMVGVIFASLSSGAGELSFLGLTHYYGHMSLAAWGSGTGGAGIIGAGLYVLFTDWIGLSVKNSLLASAFLPVIMLISFFIILPRGPLRQDKRAKGYDTVPDRDLGQDDIEDDLPNINVASSLLSPAQASTVKDDPDALLKFRANIRRAKSLFFPYMLPLLLVYVAEYTINQGVSPTLLFPLESTPFREFRDFYPMYGFLYQLGVFISRSSIAFIRIRHLYLPSFLQIGNLVLLTLHALFPFIPSVYVVFVIIFWEGLLGGAVYVNTFAEIMETVPPAEREFSLGATSVSDSGGICIAGFISMAMEVRLCNWQVQHGIDWCKKIQIS
ncbi:Batten's disease protein Cln3 [Hypomontagnella monticulosa]|nr:Batten's disease protein Cln3 [Hypomontagnella monticulosa]